MPPLCSEPSTMPHCLEGQKPELSACLPGPSTLCPTSPASAAAANPTRGEGVRASLWQCLSTAQLSGRLPGGRWVGRCWGRVALPSRPSQLKPFNGHQQPGSSPSPEQTGLGSSQIGNVEGRSQGRWGRDEGTEEPQPGWHSPGRRAWLGGGLAGQCGERVPRGVGYPNTLFCVCSILVSHSLWSV